MEPQKPTQDDERAWPWWMRRFIACGSAQALEGLVWSVGGSPPYGGVGWDEAEAVYALIEAYRGPGAAGEGAYAAVRKHIGADPEKQLTLQAFALHDRIASDAQHFHQDDVDAGHAVAQQLGDDALVAYFALLAAQLAHQAGLIDEAHAQALEAFQRYLPLAQADPVYAEPLGKAAANGTSYAVLAGDFPLARVFGDVAVQLGYREHLRVFAAMLASAPPQETNAQRACTHAGDLLERNELVAALEWFVHAESLAVEQGDEPLLCGLLGDMAVAFRRAGNEQRAITLYREAIELCRRHHDDLDLARWSGNLGSLLNSRGDLAGARAALTEAAAAAQRTGRAEQAAIAQGNLAALLREEGRHTEALEHLASAQGRGNTERPSGDEPAAHAGPAGHAEPAAAGAAASALSAADRASLSATWQRDEWTLRLKAARAAREARQAAVALDAIATGLHLIEGDSSADAQRFAAALLLERAAVQELNNDLVGAAETLEEAAQRCDAAGDDEAAQRWRELASRYDV